MKSAKSPRNGRWGKGDKERKRETVRFRTAVICYVMITNCSTYDTSDA